MDIVSSYNGEVNWEDTKQFILLHDGVIKNKTFFSENYYIDKYVDMNDVTFLVIWEPVKVGNDHYDWDQQPVANIEYQSDDYDEVDLYRRLNGLYSGD